MIITDSDSSVIADMPAYEGPVPRVGEYLFHPRLDDDWRDDVRYAMPRDAIAGCVKAVTWALHGRPTQLRAKYFVTRRFPYVEVQI